MFRSSEDRILPEKMPNILPGHTGTMGKTVTSLSASGRIDMKNDLLVLLVSQVNSGVHRGGEIDRL